MIEDRLKIKSNKRYIIRPYKPSDEDGWLRCRVLAFLGTTYFDDVCCEKETYDFHSIELVAEADGLIVGLIDIECKEKIGMIWHLAVHPDHQRRGIGKALLAAARKNVQEWGIKQFEAWTRDDKFVGQWYQSQGFELVQSYYHVYFDCEGEMEQVVKLYIPGLRPLSVFAHYVGDDPKILKKFKRVHRCNKYVLFFKE